MSYRLNIIVCHSCEHRQRVCAGRCECTLDGQDIIAHSLRGECPRLKFPPDDASIPEPKPPEPLKALPRKDWPDWIKNFADAHQSDDDKSFADTVVREIGPFGSELFKKWYKAITGTECGCADREAEWRVMYPYVTPPSPA